MKKDVKISLVENGKLSRGGWLSIVAFLLVAVIALSVALGLVVKAGKDDKSKDEAFVEAGGMVLNEETQENGITLLSTVIPKEQYEEYGIMPIAESAQQLTATVTPSAASVFMDWSVAWKEGTSGKFGNGKTVTEYVTVTPTTDGALTANVQCLKAFGEQIVVTAAVRGKENVKATCTVDYASSLESVKLNFGSSSSNVAFYADSEGCDYLTRSSEGRAASTLQIFPQYTESEVYTLHDTFELTKLNVRLNQSLVSKLKSACSSSSSNVQRAIQDVIDANRSIVIGQGVDDLRYRRTSLNFLFGATSFNSSEEAEMVALLQNSFFKDDWRTRAIEFTGVFTGTYSTCTFTMYCGFNATYFESVVGSVSLSSGSIVFHS